MGSPVSVRHAFGFIGDSPHEPRMESKPDGHAGTAESYRATPPHRPDSSVGHFADASRRRRRLASRSYAVPGTNWCQRLAIVVIFKCCKCSSGGWGESCLAFREFSSLRTHFWPAYRIRLLYADIAHVKNRSSNDLRWVWQACHDRRHISR